MRRQWQGLLEGLAPQDRPWARVMRASFGPLAVLVVAIQAVEVTRPARQLVHAHAIAASARSHLGVPVIWNLATADPAPKRDFNGIPYHWQPLPAADAPAALRAVSDALAVFPDHFAGRLLSAVYVVAGLSYGDQPVGGMALGSAVYIVASGMSVNENRAYVRQIVFHETATILLARFSIDREAWERAWRENNPPGFTYASDRQADPGFVGDAPLTALTGSMTPDPALFASGFVSTYGQASVRADVDTYADAIFTQPTALRDWMAVNGRVREKVRQLQHLYLTADPRFAEVFTRLGLPLPPP